MINRDVFVKRLSERRCQITNIKLQTNEFLISIKQLPSLYGGRYSKEDDTSVKEYISYFNKNIDHIIQLDGNMLNEVRLFFNLLFKNDNYINEREVHLYIYLFWDKLIWDKPLIENIKKQQLFYEGKILDNTDKFQSNLLPYISNNCDIIHYDESTNSIDLIEIKNVELDDRAVAQIQRYFKRTSFICDSLEHNLMINKLKPALIIKDNTNIATIDSAIKSQHWLTFPLYFRELIQIFSFSFCDIKQTIILKDLKPKLKCICKNEHIRVLKQNAN